jgi:hypothetical protein
VGCLTALVGFVIVLVITSVVEGYVLSILWRWFVIDTFGASIPQISVAQAIGLALVMNLLIDHTSSSNSDSSSSPVEILLLGLGLSLLKAGVALFWGWVIYQFV